MSGILLGFVGGTYGRRPDAPTIGTATYVDRNTATVTYTAPANDGGSAITSFTATASPGGVSATVFTSASGSITVPGLTPYISYTFTVTATSAVGTSSPSAASNSLILYGPGQVEYTTAGTYYWTAPFNVTSVCVVAVGGGGGGGFASGGYIGGGGGGLGWKNNISVTPGQTYLVQVGHGANNPGYQTGTQIYIGGDSYFIDTATVRGGGGLGSSYNNANGYNWGTYTGDGGSEGSQGGSSYGSGYPAGNGGPGGGGAGGYAPWSTNPTPFAPAPPKGGHAGSWVGYTYVQGGNGNAGYAGGGGSGGGGVGNFYYNGNPYFNAATGSGGGGVSIYGQGASGYGGLGTSIQYELVDGQYNPIGIDQVQYGGGGGSGGGNGTAGGSVNYDPYYLSGNTSGGLYGGGGGIQRGFSAFISQGGGGAVRIIWGTGRAFPSTNTGNV